MIVFLLSRIALYKYVMLCYVMLLVNKFSEKTCTLVSKE